ncbi:MAG TPA: GtrA family protein [Phaeodactylibacter sp.]|nr:GtrA family protein [Phaeodactylibacter sp.]
MSEKKTLAKLFVDAQFAAFIGTVVDFATMVFLKEILAWWYGLATAAGSFLGACTNFLLGRYWVFQSNCDKMAPQAFRYVVVAVGSLVLNTVGVILVTECFGISYFYARIIVATIIAISYNFVLQKNYIFK